MPRRREIAKRVILPDPKYNDRLVAKFMNVIMFGGKKSTAEGIVYGALDLVAAKISDNPLDAFKKALENVRPVVEVRSRRVGGSTYQVPVEVRQERRNALAIRWIMIYARARGEKTMAERLAGEILDASNNRGAAIKKKEDTHRMAEANKAFAHYRW
ncbi:MAG: 30S ribosomal protein S7 [Deltaproteobacteria bacterium HGW-Deltaproteobacteria-4]|nr:MAG: 30S ribosomal protein S7 [Deltaproteobacteria bacterium HGW-Deltaproteobacteria-4]